MTNPMWWASKLVQCSVAFLSLSCKISTVGTRYSPVQQASGRISELFVLRDTCRQESDAVKWWPLSEKHKTHPRANHHQTVQLITSTGTRSDDITITRQVMDCTSVTEEKTRQWSKPHKFPTWHGCYLKVPMDYRIWVAITNALQYLLNAMAEM